MSSPKVITLIGGGGKTGLMFYLVNLLKSNGVRAVATSTTKLSSDSSFSKINSVTEGLDLLRNGVAEQGPVVLVLGMDDMNPDKMVGIPKDWVDYLAAKLPYIFFIVEGDGSAGRSLKGHLNHEPVIPASSKLVIPVIGIDVIGVPLNSYFVHRPERVTQMIDAPAEANITVDMVLKLFFHPQGYLKQCPAKSQVMPFINKVEGPIGFGQAQELAKGILSKKHNQIQNIIMGSLVRQRFVTANDSGG
ncbi:selenium cofactor biosynthesis protein YqeC [Desulfotomaculum defluvii]